MAKNAYRADGAHLNPLRHTKALGGPNMVWSATSLPKEALMPVSPLPPGTWRKLKEANIRTIPIVHMARDYIFRTFCFFDLIIFLKRKPDIVHLNSSKGAACALLPIVVKKIISLFTVLPVTNKEIYKPRNHLFLTWLTFFDDDIIVLGSSNKASRIWPGSKKITLMPMYPRLDIKTVRRPKLHSIKNESTLSKYPWLAISDWSQ